MQSLFDVEQNAEMVTRIRALPGDRKPEWGKLDAGRMLAHCQIPFRIASGEQEMKRSFLGFLLGRLVKKAVVGPKPFKRGLPTDKRFIPAGPCDAAAEKGRLVELVEQFNQAGPKGVACDQHPFFGTMTPQNWDALLWKHTDHHLRQFGV